MTSRTRIHVHSKRAGRRTSFKRLILRNGGNILPSRLAYIMNRRCAFLERPTTVKDKLSPSCVIQENAKRITELHNRIHETVKHRDDSPEARAAWSQACAEFHAQYDGLAFPGGYEAGLLKIHAGDEGAIENALAFLEVRPYFFRSGYMRIKLMRRLKHAELSARQAERFQRVLVLEKEWKMRA